ncbi:unnamed protein product [Gadus morhua 'NCC']
MAALVAPFDDERQDSFVYTIVSDHEILKSGVKTKAEDATGVLESLSELHRSNPGDIYCSSKSMENLVKDAEDKLFVSVCFPNAEREYGSVSPAYVITEDTWLRQDEVWNSLTQSYGCVTPVDWKHSRTRALRTLPLDLGPSQRRSDVTTELSVGGEEEEEEEEEEAGLRDQLDMHSIIVPFLNQEPLFTAEQVMEELEAMMQDSLDLEASLSSEDRRGSGYEERLGAMRVAELNELLQETESHIQAFSEELVQELARREELDFEKEVKNGFIALLIDVQNRQKELRETLRRRKKLKNPQSQPERTRGARFSMEGFTSVFQYGFRQTFGSGCSETQQYLTTLIPYEKRVGPPSIEDLQVLTNILQAMKENSDKVPSLLTDYILKVLCPT